MDQGDQKRSFSRIREYFPTIPPGRTSLATSSETVTSERPLSGLQRQISYSHVPCPPSIEKPKRQRPSIGHSSTSLGEEVKRQRPNSGLSYTSLDVDVKRQRPDSGQKMTKEVFDMAASGHTCLACELEDKATRYKLEMLYQQENRDVEQLQSSSLQQFGNESTPTPNLTSCCSENQMATNRPPTPVAIDAKAERKRKRMEKKEREAKKIEEARKKEQDKLEREIMMTELSRNRSMFNGNRETIPAIGKKTAEVNFHTGKLPKIQEHEITGPSLPDNNAVDVIKKHDAEVRTTAIAKKITQDYMYSSVGLVKSSNVNEAIGVIEKHEEEVGRKHAMYTGSYPTGSCTAACQLASTRSRCSSGVSRWTAA